MRPNPTPATAPAVLLPARLTSFDCIAFDADDTLWHNETYFATSEERFLALVAPFAPEGEDLSARLHRTEIRNLALFGYGAKGFTLSMIETAIEVTEGAIPAGAIQTLIDIGREILAHPVELLDGVAETIRALRGRTQLLVITKGDLLHQESKFASSGIADDFDGLEIVNEKDPETYRRVLARRGIAPERFCMVGNSLRSDVLPVVAIGAEAVHVPYHLTWAHEIVEGHRHHQTLESLTEFLAWVARREQAHA
jgi:putative hydrolase of the HAD superfamily